jgi:hypothetical protein
MDIGLQGRCFGVIPMQIGIEWLSNPLPCHTIIPAKAGIHVEFDCA